MDAEQKIAEIEQLERIQNPAKTLTRILLLMTCLTIPSLLSGQDSSHLQNVRPVETTPELVPQIGHVDQPSSIDLGGRGDLLVTASADKIILWDRASGQQLRSFAPTQNGLQYVGAALASDEKAVIGLDRYHLDFWNASTGGLIRQVDLPDVGPLGASSMRLSPDGTRAALGGRGDMGPTSAPFVVSLESGKRLVELDGKYRFASYALAFSPDGQLLADGNYDQFARVHDVATGKLLAEFTPKTGPIESVAFSPDGKRVAATTNDECHSLDKPGTSSVGSAYRAHDCNGHIFVWDIGTNSLIWRSPNQPHTVGNAVFISGDSLLVSFGTQVEEWQISSGTFLRTIDTYQPAAALVVDIPNNVLATTGWTTQVAALDSGAVRWRVQSKTDLVSTLAVSSSASKLIMGERSGSLAFFNSSGIASTHLLRRAKISNDWVRTIAVNDAAGLIAVPRGETDGLVRLLNLKDGSFSKDISTSLKVINSVAFSADGELLAVAGDTRDPNDTAPHHNPDDPSDVLGMFIKRITVILLDSHRGNVIRTMVTDAPVGDVLVTPDGLLIAHIQLSKDLWEWRVTDGSIVYAPHHDSGAAPDPFSSKIAALSPDGAELAQYDGNNLILVDTASLRPRLPPISFFDLEGAVCEFSRDGKLFAVGGGDIAIFDARNGKKLLNILGNGNHISGLQFSSDGKFLYSASFDGTLRIWNAKTGNLLLTLLFPGEKEEDADWLAITPDGLFDGTASAMQSVSWRSHNTNNLVPLDAFFTDFYHPGLFEEVMSGEQPKAELDIATVLQVPGLRTMLAQKQAHVEIHNGQTVVCFEQKPGAVINVGPTDQRIFFPTINGYEPGTTPTCRFEKVLPAADSDSASLSSRLQNWKSEAVSTPWDGRSSQTDRSILHVMNIGVTKYPSSSGFDPLPYAVPSARAIDLFFQDFGSSGQKLYSNVHVWNGLYDEDATKENIEQRFSEMGKEISEDDVVLIYLAGHGKVAAGAEMFYFIPVDGRHADLGGTALSTALLAEALRNLPAKRIILIVDACQSGGAIEALSKIGAVKVQAEERRSEPKPRKGSPQKLGVGVYLVAATLPLSYAVGLPKGESALAETLLMRLQQVGETVTALGLASYIRDQLPTISARTTSGFKQVPLIQSVGLDFPLATR